MASDTGATGTNYYLKFGSTVLSTNYRSASISDDMGLVDQSAGSDTGTTYLTTLRNGTMNTTIKHKAGDTALWSALAPGTSDTLEWGEEGTAAGKPKHTVLALVESRNKSANYNDLVVVDLTFRYNDPSGPTDTTY
jgi:hypothetical protein